MYESQHYLQASNLDLDPNTDLNLHFEMMLKVGQQREEDGQRQFKHLCYRWDTVLRQRHAQVLFDGVREQFIGTENGSRVLQYAQ